MNHLVYKGNDPNPASDLPGGMGMHPPGPAGLTNDASTSKILFKRLSNKGPISSSSKISLLESSRSKSSAMSMPNNSDAPTFQQWVRSKDAEKRLRKKLLNEQKREVRSELLDYAK